MKLASYLGRPVSELLEAEEIAGWTPSRWVENEPGVDIGIHFEFDEHGLEVECDEFERIRTIFVQRGDAEALLDISFGSTRHDLLDRFGTPTAHRSEARLVNKTLCSWDRFPIPGGALHVQYRMTGEIERITLMTFEAIPRPSSNAD